MSYECGTHKVNKKKLTYTHRYTGCMHWVIPYNRVIDAIWMACNKFTIIDLLRTSRDVDLYRNIYEYLKEHK